MKALPSSALRLLHVEDSLADAELIGHVLHEEWPDCTIQRVESRPQLCSALRDQSYDVVLSDFTMPNFNGLAALALVREQQPFTPFIFLSGTIGEDNAIEALKNGATDYVIKDRMTRLVPAIHRALGDVREQGLRHQAEKRLRQQAHWLNEARDAVCVADLDGRLTYWNQSAARWHGWTNDEIRDRFLPDLFGAANTAILAGALQQLRAHGSWSGEICVPAAAGGSRYLASKWSLIHDTAGQPESVLILSNDVTGQRDLETQLRRAQRVESIGMLAGGIAHDLNNMLAPLLIAADILRQKYASPDTLRLLDVMTTSAQHGSALVRQVLAFARGAEGERRILQAQPIIRDVARLLSQTMPRSIDIQVQTAPNLWPIVSDATQLNQVLLNLGLNARDAMPTGGQLVIQAANRDLEEDDIRAQDGVKPGPYVIITVEDTGTGIARDVLDRMFEPFFTTKDYGKGTGLGLATVLAIVKSHGGFLKVDSEPGQGTAFQLFFPVTPETASAVPAMNLPAVKGGQGEIILVIDDESSIRELIRTLLEAYGYRALLASDGVSAVKLYRRHAKEIRLVLSDMMMPGLQRAELIGALRAIKPTVKLVLMSGLLEPDNAMVAAELGCEGFLQKPMTGETLLRTIETALAQNMPAAV